MVPKQLPRRNSEVARAKKSGLKRQKLAERSERPSERRSWRQSARESARRKQRGKNASAARRKKTKPVRENDKRRRSGDARSGKSATRKTRSAVAKTERGLTKREKKSACASKRSERNTRRAERPVSRRSAKKMPSESVAYKRSLTEIEVGAIVVAVAVAGLPSATGIVVDETGAGEGAGQEADHPNAVHLSSLKTSKTSRWTTTWHCNFYYRRASK